jgi:hypothetical protein
MWKRNVFVLGATVMAIFAFGYLAKSLDLFRYINVSYELSITIVFVFIGVGAFWAFSGGFWTRTVLATSAPAVAFSLGEIISVISGSPDDGYRGLGIVIGAILARVSFLGCVFVGGPIFLWRQYQRERHLTPQSSADALKRAADF